MLLLPSHALLFLTMAGGCWLTSSWTMILVPINADFETVHCAMFNHGPEVLVSVRN